MTRYALKSLFRDKGKLLMSSGGMAVALVLILVLGGVFAGSSKQVTDYISESHADVWAMQTGVANMHMATTIVPDNLAPRIERVAGVKAVTSILYSGGFIDIKSKKNFTYLVGFDPAGHGGGPWKMAEGTSKIKNGQMVMDKTLAAQNDVEVGDRIDIRGLRLEVSGLSDGTFTLANSMMFLTLADLQRIARAPGQASYYLVSVKKGYSSVQAARRIKRDVPGLNAVTRDRFVANDTQTINQMGIDTIYSMSVIAYLIGIMVVGLAIYTATVARTRDYGVLKAIGARGLRLYWAVVVQSLVSALIGFVLGVALAFGTAKLVGVLVPELLVLIEPATVAQVLVAALVMGLVGALAPARKMNRIEPSVAFRA